MNNLPDTESRAQDHYRTSRAISLTLILSCAVVALACIAAITVAVTAFLMNPPW